MTNSKSSNTYNRQNWEQSDFPIVCETCLGDNSFVRMLKEPHGKECKICQRPFTIFRWQPGSKARFKKTEVCQVCAKTKNVCQTCILDLEFGLPVQVRDQGVRASVSVPRGSVNREYHQQQTEAALSVSKDPVAPYGGLIEVGGKARPPSDMLMRLARTEPYYKRNRPHICSFFVKGSCNRGEACPFRHERPSDPDDPLSQQNIKDRYHGVEDPVAHKLFDKYRGLPSLPPPEDRSITTLYLGNVPESVDERQLRDIFCQYGAVRAVTVSARQRCAFVQFANREAAERAAEKSYDRLIVAGQRLTVNWGKAEGEAGARPPRQMPVPGLPATMLAFPPPPLGAHWALPACLVPPPPPPPTLEDGPALLAGLHYPSQDPSRLGAAPI